jgi:hypothetical protein
MLEEKFMKHRDYYYAISILFCLCCSGCGTMMVFLGDNVRFSISGNVQDGNSGKDIFDVSVFLDCSGIEKSMYQDGKCETGINGNYELSGNWELNGCQMNFEHEDYQPISVIINESHLVTSEGLSRVYKVDVLLKQKATN